MACLGVVGYVEIVHDGSGGHDSVLEVVYAESLHVPHSEVAV